MLRACLESNVALACMILWSLSFLSEFIGFLVDQVKTIFLNDLVIDVQMQKFNISLVIVGLKSPENSTVFLLNSTFY